MKRPSRRAERGLWISLSEAIRRARVTASLTRAFQQQPAAPVARLLVIGDSTGVGVGVGQPEQSLAGLLGAAYAEVEVVNRCRNGARLADLLHQLTPADRFDVALVMGGGNDVLQHTPQHRLRADARALLRALAPRARHTVWLGSANIGASPKLPRPMAWWFTWRTGRAMRLLAAEALSHGVLFIDFFRPPDQDLFARRASVYFAEDGLHPSARTYRHCFEVLRRAAPLDAWLADTRRAAPLTSKTSRPPEVAWSWE